MIQNGRPAALFVDPGADPAVRRAGESFARDLERVGGKPAERVNDVRAARGELIVAGVLGQSPAIDDLVRASKIGAGDIAGEWEAFRQIVVERPFPNVPRALVIVGSDRRGAVFGMYDLCEKMGVSPWYWFADVPVRRQANLFIAAGSRREQPKVKYRGFFINDQDPAFSGWARKRFGGVNADAYAHVFELNLRLKGIYLWPAMWAPKAFALDDARNIPLADEMGMVIGTSHHEPIDCAQSEWHRSREGGVTGGKWDYASNGANLRAFWRGGIERMMSKDEGAYENLVTVGMRGDGDEPMSEGTAIGRLGGELAPARVEEVLR